MPFNIEEFKSQLQYGRLAKSNNFEAYVFGPGSNDLQRNLPYRIESAEFPGRAIQTADRKIMGPQRRLGYDSILTDVNFQILLSEDFREKIYLEEWQDKIIGNYRTGQISQEMFDIGYYDDYVGTVEVYQYDEAGIVRYKAKLLECYPIQINSIQSSWENVGTISKLNVTFHSRFFEDEILN